MQGPERGPHQTGRVVSALSQMSEGTRIVNAGVMFHEPEACVME